MAITQSINLTASDFKTTPVVHMVQGDTGRVLKCIIGDTTLQAAWSACIWCERPDGTIWSTTGTISTDDNSATFALNVAGGATSQVGNVKAQVKLTDATAKVVSTFDLRIAVEHNIAGQSTTEDVSWRDSLTAAIQSTLSAHGTNISTLMSKVLVYGNAPFFYRVNSSNIDLLDPIPDQAGSSTMGIGFGILSYDGVTMGIVSFKLGYSLIQFRVTSSAVQWRRKWSSANWTSWTNI